MKALLSSVLLSVALTTQAAGLNPQLDQSNVFSVASALAVASGYSEAQTLTCGLAGSLSRVDVAVLRGPNTTADLVLSIWSTAADGSPLAKLASSSLPASAIPNQYPDTLVSFENFSQSVTVSPGELIGIRLDSAAPDLPPYNARYDWYYETPGQYAGGRLFVYGGISIDQANTDLYFQTFVTPVPEPGIGLLLLLPMGYWLGRRAVVG